MNLTIFHGRSRIKYLDTYYCTWEVADMSTYLIKHIGKTCLGIWMEGETFKFKRNRQNLLPFLLGGVMHHVFLQKMMIVSTLTLTFYHRFSEKINLT